MKRNKRRTSEFNAHALELLATGKSLHELAEELRIRLGHGKKLEYRRIRAMAGICWRFPNGSAGPAWSMV